MPFLTHILRGLSGDKAQAGFIGKVPSCQDFIRYQAGSGTGRALHDWISSGISHLPARSETDWREKLATFPTYRFYVAPRGPLRPSLGIIKASRDTVGREHPFVRFLTLPSSVRVRQFTDLLPSLSAYFGAMEVLRSADGKHLELPELIEQSQHLERSHRGVDARREKGRGRTILGGMTMGAWWDALSPDFNASQRLRFASDLIGILNTIAARGPGRVSWGLRLPLPGQENMRLIFLIFWFSLVSGLLRSARWTPYAFWNDTENAENSLTIFFREPASLGFTDLVFPVQGESSSVDILRRPLEKTGNLDDRILVSLVEETGMPLQSALDAWIKAGERQWTRRD